MYQGDVFHVCRSRFGSGSLSVDTTESEISVYIVTTTCHRCGIDIEQGMKVPIGLLCVDCRRLAERCKFVVRVVSLHVWWNPLTWGESERVVVWNAEEAYERVVARRKANGLL